MYKTIIIQSVALAYFVWLGIADHHNRKKKLLADFAEMTKDTIDFINESNENDIANAKISLYMAKLMKRRSFCKKTDQQLKKVQLLWQKKYHRLFISEEKV